VNVFPVKALDKFLDAIYVNELNYNEIGKRYFANTGTL